MQLFTQLSKIEVGFHFFFLNKNAEKQNPATMNLVCPSYQVLNLQGNPWDCSCPLLDVSEETNNKTALTGGKFKLDST